MAKKKKVKTTSITNKEYPIMWVNLEKKGPGDTGRTVDWKTGEDVDNDYVFKHNGQIVKISDLNKIYGTKNYVIGKTSKGRYFVKHHNYQDPTDAQGKLHDWSESDNEFDRTLADAYKNTGLTPPDEETAQYYRPGWFNTRSREVPNQPILSSWGTGTGVDMYSGKNHNESFLKYQHNPRFGMYSVQKRSPVNRFSYEKYMSPEEKALYKANTLIKPASNYSSATDMNIPYLREWLTDKIQNIFPNCPTGLSNCTLTVSQFYGDPIGRAATIVNNPQENGFYQVPEEYAVPGTMVIASSPEGTENPVYHTMILSGYADKDYPFEYNGIHYDIKKGEPLVHYSKGKNSAESYKKNIPLKVYNDQSEGKTLNRFYRPLDENGNPVIFLPEVEVIAK